MSRLTPLILLSAILLSGCARFDPRLDQEIDNQNGKIDEIRNNQNGISLELGNLKQQSEIVNSQLKEVQTGMVNMNAALSRNENSGIQILQGDGALMLVLCVIVVGMILWHYRRLAVKNAKTAEILAQRIAAKNDAELNDDVLMAAMFTDCEGEVFNLLKKYRS